MLKYFIEYLPVLLAIIGELGIVKACIKKLGEMKETKEYRTLVSQNKQLISELKEQQKLNKELLTKIDKIDRGD